MNLMVGSEACQVCACMLAVRDSIRDQVSSEEVVPWQEGFSSQRRAEKQDAMSNLVQGEAEGAGSPWHGAAYWHLDHAATGGEASPPVVLPIPPSGLGPSDLPPVPARAASLDHLRYPRLFFPVSCHEWSSVESVRSLTRANGHNPHFSTLFSERIRPSVCATKYA